MKAIDLILELKKYDPDTDIDFIVSDDDDNSNADSLYVNSYQDKSEETGPREVIELDMKLESGLMVITKTEYDCLITLKEKYE